MVYIFIVAWYRIHVSFFSKAFFLYSRMSSIQTTTTLATNKILNAINHMETYEYFVEPVLMKSDQVMYFVYAKYLNGIVYHGFLENVYDDGTYNKLTGDLVLNSNGKVYSLALHNGKLYYNSFLFVLNNTKSQQLNLTCNFVESIKEDKINENGEIISITYNNMNSISFKLSGEGVSAFQNTNEYSNCILKRYEYNYMKKEFKESENQNNLPTQL